MQDLFSFNSTLVQLKGPIYFGKQPVNICFNSTLVQLKDGKFKESEQQ